MRAAPGRSLPFHRWTSLIVVGVSVGLLGLPLVGVGVFAATDLVVSYPPWRVELPRDFQPINPLVADTVDAVLPTRANFRARLYGRDFAEWTPDPNGGSPLGSVPNGGVLAPLNLPYLLMPLWYAPVAAKLLELVVAIGGCYLLTRRLGLSKAAAWLAGLVYAFSGFQVVWTNWPHAHVGALFPALFWSLDLAVERRDAISVVAVAAVTAAMLLEGFPAVAAYGVFGGAAFAVVRAVGRHPSYRVRGRALALAAGGVALGVAFSGYQLLTFVNRLDLMVTEARAQTPSDHLPFETLWTMLVPNALGSPVDRTYFGARNYAEVQVFLGAAATALVLVGLAHRRANRRERCAVWFFVTGSLVCGWLIFAGGPLLGLFQRLPPLDIVFAHNFVGRLRSLLLFCLSMLAAFGYDALLDRSPAGRREIVVRSSLVIALAGLIAWRLPALLTAAREADQLGYVLSSVRLPAASLVLTVVILALVASPRSDAMRSVLLRAVPVIIAVEVVALAGPFWPRPSTATFYPVTSTHRYLYAHLGADRLASGRNVLYPGTTTLYGLRSVTAHDFVHPGWADMLSTVDPRAFSLSRTFPILQPSAEFVTSPILDRLAVRYFVNPLTVPVLGTRIPAPRATGSLRWNPGEVIQLEVPPTTRAVVLNVLGGLRSLPPDAAVSAELLDRYGRAVRTGVRPLGWERELPRTGLEVPLAVRGPSSRGLATLRLRLEASDGALEVAAAGRVPAATVVTDRDDGLEIVFVDGSVVYRRHRALPRIRWASHALVLTGPEARLRRLSQPLDPRTVVLNQPGPRADGAPAELTVIADGGDAVEVEVDASGSGYLVVADALQAGWVAYLDGDPVGLVPADHALVAVNVPRGEHHVRLAYEPKGAQAGLTLTATSGTFLAVLAIRHVLAVRRRRRTGPGSARWPLSEPERRDRTRG